MTITDESYRKLVQTLKDPVLMTTPSGDLLDINQAGLDTLGYPAG